jgi:high affinity Mn2+ porin
MRSPGHKLARAFALGLTLVAAGVLRAEVLVGEGWLWAGHWQATVVPQWHDNVPAAYSGKASLWTEAEERTSLTSTLFLATRLMPSLELYVDPELSGGSGISGTQGVAGYPNGEIYRVSDPYPAVSLARAYLQWTVALGGATEPVESDQHSLAGARSISRAVLRAGKFSLNDFFDDNTYSHDPRTQFLNWALMDVGAWDYAADTRGYTMGLCVELDHDNWALRFAEVQVPSSANGPDLDRDIIHARSENLEADAPWTLGGQAGAARVIGYWNHADMGNYSQTLTTPAFGMDVTRSRSVGALKYGFGLNLEQGLAKDTGLFARLGWNDGATETWAFTEIDRSASAGLQMGGPLWGRERDRLGLAYLMNGLSDAHRDYLAAGGYGFIIGDGALNYAPEQIIEAYYSWSPWAGLTLSPDFQWVRNPAYNQDRGPAAFYALRAHFEI